MNPIVIGMLVFVCTFGGALAGMKLGTVLPEHHRSDASRDTINIGTALIATMTALVLGLVTASAKNSFDAVDRTIRETAVNILTLDRDLARYGSETAPLRANLKLAVAGRIESTWPEGGTSHTKIDPLEASSLVEQLASHIRGLVPKTDEQRGLQSRAVDLAESLLKVRFQVLGSLGDWVPTPFLTVLIFWLTITFTSFGLFAPRNATVVSVLFLCALSVAAAVFLILEMDGPFEGLIKVSPGPLKFALENLNR